MNHPHGPYGSCVLELPADLIIDPVTTDRLVRQLATAPDAVVGVVALRIDVPPGSSTRVQAEWQSLQPLDATHDLDAPADGHRIDGAVLLRPGIEATTDGDRVLVPQGILRVDPGSVVHSAIVGASPDQDASDAGRSPFPWRPVVLFLATDPVDPAGTGAGLEVLIDALLDLDVEPRLAAPMAPIARRRHGPCAPTAATVEHLAPDVIVALDDAALATAPSWCTRRGTVIVDMTAAVDDRDGIELQSWQIDRHPGRVRARVSPAVAAADLARLVSRLAAGPQPVPPTDRGDPGVPGDPVVLGESGVLGKSNVLGESSVDVGLDPGAPASPAVVVGTIRTIVVVEPRDLADRPLLDGLADRLVLAGHQVRRSPLEPAVHDDAAVADVLFVADPDRRAVAALVTGRARTGRPTVLVVDAVDADHLDQVARLHLDLGLDLDPELSRYVVAVAADHDIVAELRREDVATQLVPVMTPAPRYEALRSAGEHPMPPSNPVIGWTMPTPTANPTAGAEIDDDPTVQAISAGLLELLAERPDITLEVAGAEAAPDRFRDHPQVVAHAGRPDAGEQARWTAHVSTPRGVADLTALLEAAHAGVPTLLAAADARWVGGLADTRLAIDPASAPDAWSAPLRQLLDGRDRPARSRRARQAGLTLDSPQASDLVVSRLLGWLDRRRPR